MHLCIISNKTSAILFLLNGFPEHLSAVAAAEPRLRVYIPHVSRYFACTSFTLSALLALVLWVCGMILPLVLLQSNMEAELLGALAALILGVQVILTFVDPYILCLHPANLACLSGFGMLFRLMDPPLVVVVKRHVTLGALVTRWLVYFPVTLRFLDGFKLLPAGLALIQFRMVVLTVPLYVIVHN